MCVKVFEKLVCNHAGLMKKVSLIGQGLKTRISSRISGWRRVRTPDSQAHSPIGVEEQRFQRLALTPALSPRRGRNTVRPSSNGDHLNPTASGVLRLLALAATVLLFQ